MGYEYTAGKTKAERELSIRDDTGASTSNIGRKQPTLESRTMQICNKNYVSQQPCVRVPIKISKTTDNNLFESGRK